MRHAEHAAGAGHLGLPVRLEVDTRRQRTGHDLALLAARRGEDGDHSPSIDEVGDEAAARERLVVRVGVDEQDATGGVQQCGGSTHGGSLRRSAQTSYSGG